MARSKTICTKLAALKPEVAITGHGVPLAGDELRIDLERLAEQFDELAVPDYGKYVDKDVH